MASLLGSLYDNIDDEDDDNKSDEDGFKIPSMSKFKNLKVNSDKGGSSLRKKEAEEDENVKLLSHDAWSSTKKMKMIQPTTLKRKKETTESNSDTNSNAIAVKKKAKKAKQVTFSVKNQYHDDTGSYYEDSNNSVTGNSYDANIESDILDKYKLLFVHIHDEYIPMKPNNYDDYYKERERQLEEKKALEERSRAESFMQARNISPTLTANTITSSVTTIKESPISKNSNTSINENDSNASTKKNFASRMMQKMGWKEGEGLGVNKQGITTPLIARKVDKRSGIIVKGNEQAKKIEADSAQKIASLSHYSRVVLLLNVVGEGGVDQFLHDEVQEEAARFGNLITIKIKAFGKKEIKKYQLSDQNCVFIFCKYERKEEAGKALMAMNGRNFGGRIVKAIFYDEEKFESDNYTPGPEIL